MSRAGPFNVKGAASASKFTPRSVGRGIVNNSSGGSYSNARSTSKSKGFTAPSERNKPANSSSTSMGSTTKSSGIQCFKCGGCGHVIRECPNNCIININDKGDYESTGGEEQEVNDDEKFQDTFEEEDHTYCEFETGAALVVTQILNVQVKEAENGQQHNLFQTRAKVEGKVCKVIIDGGS
jgi:ferredoxin